MRDLTDVVGKPGRERVFQVPLPLLIPTMIEVVFQNLKKKKKKVVGLK